MRDRRGEARPQGSRVVNELLICVPLFFFSNFVLRNPNVHNTMTLTRRCDSPSSRQGLTTITNSRLED